MWLKGGGMLPPDDKRDAEMLAADTGTMWKLRIEDPAKDDEMRRSWAAARTGRMRGAWLSGGRARWKARQHQVGAGLQIAPPLAATDAGELGRVAAGHGPADAATRLVDGRWRGASGWRCS